MSIVNGYATLADLKALLGITGAESDAVLEDVIEAASRWIDSYTGRRFYASAETRYYTAEWGDLLEVDDLLSVTTLKTDENGDRVYEHTWATTDYDLEPYNATPKTAIRVTPNGNRVFPTTRKGVELAGSFGYAAVVPDDVREACLLQAAFLFTLKQAPLGIAGNGEIGQAVAVGKVHPTARGLMAAFRATAIGGI